MQKAAGKLKGEKAKAALGLRLRKFKGPVPLWRNERVANPRRKTYPVIAALS